MFGVELWLFVVSVLCYAYYRWAYSKTAQLLSKLPGPKPWPIVGNFGGWSRIPKDINPVAYFFEYQEEMSRLYQKENMFVLWLGSHPLLYLTAPETVETVLSSNNALQKGSLYRFIKPWLADGLLLSTGEKWRKHRKLLTPSFHFRILEKFEPIMNEQTNVLIAKIKEASSQSDWVDAFELYNKCTLDIIYETAMGMSVGAQEKDSFYGKMIHNVAYGVTLRSGQPWLSPDCIFNFTKLGKSVNESIKYLHGVTDQVIADRMAERKRTMEDSKPVEEPQSEFATKKRLAFLDLLLESDLNPQELREQVDTFMFAGHDTTSVALGWMTYLLGLYPKVQDQLLEEIDSVFGDDKTRDVTQDDLKQLKYMEAVMKESQRVYPSVPLISRTLDNNTLIGGYEIPKGTECAVSIYSVHHNPRHYPDPDVFDPERFSPENSTGRHPYAFIPFSAGPRNCIGQKFALMEQKIVMSHILRNFTILSLDQRDKISLVPDLVTRTAEPVRTKFVIRQ